MTNEASHLKQLIETCKKPAKIIAVTSGKGGVGKTNISANLGICLAAAQKKVLLLDADLSLGNLDIIININSKYNISHLLNGKKNIEEIIHLGPQGLEVICGASGLEELANLGEFQRHRLLKELSKLQDDNDIIIVDTAAGISKSVISFCLAADQVLVVTTPEATAITDAYAMIKVLAGNNFEGKINLVVNMAENIAEGKKTYQQIANVARRFLNVTVGDAGILLRDQKVSTAVRQRNPFVLSYPKAKITASMATLAAKFSSIDSSAQNNNGFFKKVVDLFF